MNKYCPEIAIQIEKEKKIKKFVKCFGVCILIFEIIFFIFNLTKKKLKKKPKKSDNNSNKVLKLSNKSKKKVDELNTSSLNIINSQTNYHKLPNKLHQNISKIVYQINFFEIPSSLLL